VNPEPGTLHETDRKGYTVKNFESLTLGQILESAAGAVPDKTAVADGEHRKTYQELDAMANALAAGLADIEPST
jgi:non-ribosomal peptide synthetase component E (peptide arylation enzyme)